MTSIISPWLHATQMATKAQDSLRTANATLNGPRPMHPGDGLVGIPEQNGPDTPDNPWFVEPIGRERGIYGVAAGHAREAISSIASALNYGQGFFSADVTKAFTRAREEAEAGVRQLTSPTTRPIDTRDVMLQFDASTVWLDVAKNLITLDQRRPMPPVKPPVEPIEPTLPPVTILPVDPPVAPGEPGSPITIQPIMPEIEAPEAMQPPTPLYPGNPDGPVAEPITIQLPHPDSPIQ